MRGFVPCLRKIDLRVSRRPIILARSLEVAQGLLHSVHVQCKTALRLLDLFHYIIQP